MNLKIDQLVAALRDELQHYGEILALLERQQHFVIHRATDDLFRSVADVQQEADTLRQARDHRDHCRHAVAAELAPAESQELSQLIPHLPGDYQPLVQALLDENNHLLIRVQQCAQQNHLLLSRSLELMQQFISSFASAPESAAYNQRGTRPSITVPSRILYEAIG
jgi:flagellar biosynthesis/type III secretory pathway chaperone